MKTISRWLAGVTVLALFCILLAPAVYAVPAMPHSFYGTLKINGADAPVGTVVKAKVSGVECGSYTTTQAGQYGDLTGASYIAVQGELNEGATINYYVSDVDTTQTATFIPGGGPTELNLTATILTIGYSPSSFSFTTTEGAGNPSSQILSISNSAANPTAMAWSVSDDATWLSLSPASGTSSGEVDSVTLSIDVSGMSTSGYSATITISDTGASNTPQTVEVSLTISAPDEAGAGAGAGAGTSADTTTVEASLFGVTIESSINNEGVIQETMEATCEDGNLTITIPKDTVALDKDDNPLDSLEASIDESPPSPPEDAHVIGLAYDFGPAEATFDPPITLEYTYDPGEIPEGVAEANLVLAYYDEGAGEWVTLDCTVDTVTHTITASVSHFTAFAILGYEVEAPPPAPAAFTLSSLSISPLEVNTGETVTISISVANTGGESGKSKVIFKVNGVVEATKEVTVAADGSELVSFTTSKDVAATYSVDVSGLTGSFTVKKAPVPPVVAPVPPAPVVAPVPPPAPVLPPAPEPVSINWWLIVGVIAACAVIGPVAWLMIAHRRG